MPVRFSSCSRWSGVRQGSRSVPAKHTFPAAEILEDRTLLSAGSIDPTFNGGEVVVTDVAGPAPLYDSHRGISVSDADGKIVVAGVSTPKVPTVRYPALARYNADGTADLSFGTAGQVLLLDHDFDVQGIALDQQGRILLVGKMTAQLADFEVLRLESDGEVDQSFGVGGRATVDFYGRTDQSRSIEVQTDGKILLAGSSMDASAAQVVALACLNGDGSIDSSFGDAGRFMLDLASTTEFAFGVATDSQNRILLGMTADETFAAAAVLSNGVLDETFGNAGVFTLTADIVSSSNWTRGFGIDPNDRLIFTGAARPSAGGDYDFFAVRVTQTGNFDDSFGTNGVALIDWAGQTESFSGFVIQADSKIVLSGSTQAPEGSLAVVARLDSEGSLDDSFGTDGRLTGVASGMPAVNAEGKLNLLTSGNIRSGGPGGRELILHQLNSDGTTNTSFGDSGQVVAGFFHHISLENNLNRVFRLNDGRVLAVGTSSETSYFPYPTLVRYLSDGSLDSSFGEGGKCNVTELENFVVADAAVSDDGSIVLVGTRQGATYTFAVARLLPDGSVDLAFGNGGLRLFDLTPYREFGRSVELLPDGRILLAGSTTGSDGLIEDIALVRLMADGQLDSGFGTDGIALIDFGGSGDWVGDLLVQSNGQILVGGYTRVNDIDEPFVARLTASGSLIRHLGMVVAFVFHSFPEGSVL